MKQLLWISICVFSTPLWAHTIEPDECSFIRENILQHKSGGEISIPSGTYTCLSPIILDHDNIWLHGAGDVNLRLGNNVNAPVIIMGEIATPPKPVSNIRVSDLHIDGNKIFQSMECWGGPCDSGGTSFIRNNGITVRHIISGRIENVEVQGGRSGGVVTEKGCEGLVVENLTSIDNFFDGFAGYETYHSKINHLVLRQNHAAGISIDLHFDNNVISNSIIENNHDVGIFMRDSNNNTFDNLSISDSNNHGIFLSYADDVRTCANGNEFRNLSVFRSMGFGFLHNSPCVGNKLTGKSQFVKNRDGCVRDASGSMLEILGETECQN